MPPKPDEINQSPKLPLNALEEFLQKALEGEDTTNYRVDRYRKADTSHLEEDLEQLELILKIDELLDQKSLEVLERHWQKLAKVAPPEMISLFCTHQKTSNILMHMSEHAKSNSRDSWFYNMNHTFILQVLARRVWPIQTGEQWRTCTIPAERGMKAIREIAMNSYFATTRGQDELNVAIRVLDQDIRHHRPPYRMVLQSNEVMPELVADNTVYLYAKGDNIHYQAKDYDGAMQTGVINRVPGFPRIEIGRNATYHCHSNSDYNINPEPQSSQFRASTEKDTLYFHAFTEKYSDGSASKKIIVSWMDERGKVHQESGCGYHSENREEKRLFDRISNFSTPLADADKSSLYNFGPIARMGLGPDGTMKLLEDLQRSQCNRELSFHEEQIIRAQLPRFRGFHDYEIPHKDLDLEMDTVDFHDRVMTNPATYASASKRAFAMDHEIDCINALRERSSAIQKKDEDVLQTVFELADSHLTDIQPSSGSAFKDLPTKAKDYIFSVKQSDKRSDLKIRRLVQVLVDIRNEIKATSKGRRLSVFGFAITSGSKTAIAIDDLINKIQQSLSEYENFKFETSVYDQENMTIVWAEGPRNEDYEKISILPKPHDLKQMQKVKLLGLLDTYINDRSTQKDSTGKTKSYLHGEFFSIFQKSYQQKLNAVNELKSALNGNDVDLTPHLSTLSNGDLGKKLQEFIKSGNGNHLIGKNVTSINDFVEALQNKNNNPSIRNSQA